MFKQSTLLFALLGMISMYGMSEGGNNPLTYKPKYEKHLKELVRHTFWGAVNAGLYIACREKSINNDALVQRWDLRNDLKTFYAFEGIIAQMLQLNFFVRTLNHAYGCAKHSVLLGNEAWKAVSGYGQPSRQQ